MLIDFHSHFLHDIDDGPSDINISLKMLSMSKKQGVDIILATPHCNRGTLTPFETAALRDERITEIIEEASEKNIAVPVIKKGVEVYNRTDMTQTEDLNSYCIENTKNILLEMPFSNWTNAHFDNITRLIEMGYTPVLAHLERYCNFVPRPLYSRLLDMNLYAQATASAFINKEIAPFVLEMIALRKIHVVGSDAHNMLNRCSLMDTAMRIIKNKLGEKYAEAVNENALYLLGA